MVFTVGDRVTWTDDDDGGMSRRQAPDTRGTVTTVTFLGDRTDRVAVRWDDQDDQMISHVWYYPEDLQHLDAVSQLGEILG